MTEFWNDVTDGSGGDWYDREVRAPPSGVGQANGGGAQKGEQEDGKKKGTNAEQGRQGGRGGGAGRGSSPTPGKNTVKNGL